ncbi:chord-domain-containing protein [Rhodotorula diobovata]|uniref:Chord-domain-containing protein n=1 Tax=Rhodotorula diobovata TaxID=5288 RepID=A0A5C5G054_9BASI|nr:chord-domain-containing protein [Rhodotorula diobovata]
MPNAKCTRRGCGLEFDPDHNDQAACSFHPGAPVFHEGLKSWSCCSAVSKPVTDFDDFMKIPPCATGTHSLEPAEPLKPAVVESPAPGPSSTSADGKEVYGSAMASTTQPAAHLPPLPAAPQLAHEDSVKKPVSTEYVEEQDDPDVEITKGMRCKRKACGAEFEDQTREDGECTYHPGVPIFHEGSKGYSCCKRRVLEFDEFLRIEGCRSGRHLFVGPKKVDDGAEELVDCRTDHYQTPRTVIVSVFGKQADKEKSSVKFEAEAMHVDLILPARKRFTKSFPLYGPIDPASSAFKILGTKCEITLAKADARSWPSITTLDPDLASKFRVQLAFSAGGGRGTVGAKEAVLDQTNQLYRNAAA